MQHGATSEVENLLHYSEQLASAGDIVSARSIVRALSRQHPHDSRVWTLVATYADSQTEREQAHERVAALALVRGGASGVSGTSGTSGETGKTASLPPPRPSPIHLIRQHGGLFVTGVVLLVLLVLIAQQWGGGTPTTPDTDAPRSSRDDVFAVPDDADADTEDADTETDMTIRPTRVPPALLAFGKPLERDGWYLAVMRPEHMQVITGTIGTLHPQGRFVLVLLTVGNTATQPRPIPTALCVLTDAQGRIYPPAAAASVAYLDTYGQGTHGDLAFDDPIPPNGLYSVPLVFDVSPDATHLVLSTTTHRQEGWPVPGW